MTATTFDTLKFVRTLKNSGMPEDQAEALTNALQEAVASVIDQTRIEYELDDVVTNKTLDSRIKETELKIELVRSDLKRDLAETKSDLIRWVVGVGILQTTLIAALLVKLTMVAS
jgi:hypothetical protein